MSHRYIRNAAGIVTECPDLLAWAEWFETADRQVAETFIGTVRISTVFLALDHNFGGRGRPILWESMVFGGPLDGEQYRYETEQQAHQGHAQLCTMVLAASAKTLAVSRPRAIKLED